MVVEYPALKEVIGYHWAYQLILGRFKRWEDKNLGWTKADQAALEAVERYEARREIEHIRRLRDQVRGATDYIASRDPVERFRNRLPWSRWSPTYRR